MATRKTQGIYVTSNKTFYYLETGDVVPRSSLDRIKNKLIQQDLISYHRTDPSDIEPDHKTITYGDAEDAGYKINPIFISDHVRKTYMARQEEESQGDPWASRNDG